MATVVTDAVKIYRLEQELTLTKTALQQKDLKISALEQEVANYKGIITVYEDRLIPKLEAENAQLKQDIKAEREKYEAKYEKFTRTQIQSSRNAAVNLVLTASAAATSTSPNGLPHRDIKKEILTNFDEPQTSSGLAFNHNGPTQPYHVVADSGQPSADEMLIDVTGTTPEPAPERVSVIRNSSSSASSTSASTSGNDQRPAMKAEGLHNSQEEISEFDMATKTPAPLFPAPEPSTASGNIVLNHEVAQPTPPTSPSNTATSPPSIAAPFAVPKRRGRKTAQNGAPGTTSKQKATFASAAPKETPAAATEPKKKGRQPGWRERAAQRNTEKPPASGTKRTRKSEAKPNAKEDETHEPDEQCQHHNCKRPDFDNVNWVMCDACEAWYHCVCQFGDNREMKNEDNFFCDCVPAAKRPKALGKATKAPVKATKAMGAPTSRRGSTSSGRSAVGSGLLRSGRR